MFFYLLFVCRLCDKFEHLARCYNKWLFRKMLQIPGHQISIIHTDDHLSMADAKTFVSMTV